MQDGVAQCVLHIDALPVRSICADDSTIYLAEAPLNGRHSSHGGHGGRLTARDPKTSRVARTLSAGCNALSCLLVTSDGQVWCGSSDGQIRVLRRGGQLLHEARAHASWVHALTEAAGGVCFSAGADFLVRVWSLSLAPLRTLRAHTATVSCLATPATAPAIVGSTVWSGGDDHVIHVWSSREEDGFAHLGSLGDFASAVRVLAAQPCATSRMWAADAAGSLRIFDGQSRAILRTAVHAGSAPPVTCVVSNLIGLVWVGDSSGGLTIYDGSSLVALTRVEGAHAGAVGGLAAPRGAVGSVVWSFGADSAVRTWRVSEQTHDKLDRMRKAMDAQHARLCTMRQVLPRAAASAAGRLEAATQRSEYLCRRLLDLEITMSVGGDALMQASQHEDSMAGLNHAQREVAAEVEDALLALRSVADELLASMHAGPSSATPSSSRAKGPPEMNEDASTPRGRAARATHHPPRAVS